MSAIATRSTSVQLIFLAFHFVSVSSSMEFGVSSSMEFGVKGGLFKWDQVQGLELTVLDHPSGHHGRDLADSTSIRLAFSAGGQMIQATLQRRSIFSTEALLTVNQNGSKTISPPPKIPHFFGKSDNNASVELTIMPEIGPGGRHFQGSIMPADSSGAEGLLLLDPATRHASTAHLATRRNDEVVTEFARHILVHAKELPSIGLTGTEDFIDKATTSPGDTRRTSDLGTLPTKRSDGSYGRLSSCPDENVNKKVNLGIVMDWGFVKANGGTAESAIAAFATILSRTNQVYDDQVGVEFFLGHLIVNIDSSRQFADTGPNLGRVELERTGQGRNQCGWPAFDGAKVQGTMGETSEVVDVISHGGHSGLLKYFAQWTSIHAPACPQCGGWHLMTDCFPTILDGSPHVTGVATMSTMCKKAQTNKQYLRDTGRKCNRCSYELENGNEARLYSYATASDCTADWTLCVGPVALSSYTSTTWHTFAHELGHTFGAGHTFNKGGLMDYNGDAHIYDNGQVCAYVSRVLKNTDGKYIEDCMADLNPVCGNGVRETGEECDTLHVTGDDGCDNTCARVCGFICTEDLGGLSTCTHACGNGVVDLEFMEDCDEDSVCCDSCKWAAGVECAASDPCCSDSCTYEGATTSCETATGESGYCSTNGECVAPTWCLWLGLVYDGDLCPIDAASPCVQQQCPNYDQASCIDGAVVGWPPNFFWVPDGTPCGTTLDGTAPRGACREGLCISPTCGNGEIEHPEECDDASSCCTNCAFTPGAACSDPENNECCTGNCALEPTSKSCDAGRGYCAAGGACETSSWCDSEPDAELDTTACPPFQDSPCRIPCSGGSGFCLRGGDRASEAFAPDGSVCDDGAENLGVCISGTCEKVQSCPVQGCLDDFEFRDKNGYTCRDWIGFSCSSDTAGYTSEDIDDVLGNCPGSCGTCTALGVACGDCSACLNSNTGTCKTGEHKGTKARCEAAGSEHVWCKDEGCISDPDYRHPDGEDCTQMAPYCFSYGDDVGNNDRTANEACCVCGGSAESPAAKTDVGAAIGVACSSWEGCSSVCCSDGVGKGCTSKSGICCEHDGKGQATACAGCIPVNHKYDNPGELTCDCVDLSDRCLEDGECVEEPACKGITNLMAAPNAPVPGMAPSAALEPDAPSPSEVCGDLKKKRCNTHASCTYDTKKKQCLVAQEYCNRFEKKKQCSKKSHLGCAFKNGECIHSISISAVAAARSAVSPDDSQDATAAPIWLSAGVIICGCLAVVVLLLLAGIRLIGRGGATLKPAANVDNIVMDCPSTQE